MYVDDTTQCTSLPNCNRRYTLQRNVNKRNYTIIKDASIRLPKTKEY